METLTVADLPALGAQLALEPGFDRASLGARLHQLDLWPRLPAGRRDLAVPVGSGEVRPVLLRVPKGYRPERAWPMIYLLHPGGSTGPAFLGYLEQLLGPAIDEYLVAAPTGYRQTGIDAPPPFTVDHRAIFDAVRRLAHVDVDRCFAFGYSTGGYAAWAVALFHADLLAGALAMGCVFTVPPGEDGLWRRVLPNFAHTAVLHVWGDRDSLPVYGLGGGRSVGSMAEINQRFSRWTAPMGLPLTDCRLPGRGHGGLTPPRGALADLLARRRTLQPAAVDHTFRHVFQGHSYWLEAHTWEGAHWGPAFPRVERGAGESEPQALGRTVGDLLGRIAGRIEGQTITVERRHAGNLTVWLGEGMIDWQQPVTLVVDGREVFRDRLRPDLDLCLVQAARTFDFSRLRWAGLRVQAAGTRPVAADTPFPPLLPPHAKSTPSRPAPRRGR